MRLISRCSPVISSFASLFGNCLVSFIHWFCSRGWEGSEVVLNAGDCPQAATSFSNRDKKSASYAQFIESIPRHFQIAGNELSARAESPNRSSASVLSRNPDALQIEVPRATLTLSLVQNIGHATAFKGVRQLQFRYEIERERFVAEWQTVQSCFVDHPKAAVTEADDLIAALLEARGYPKDSFEQRAADVSVTYPRVMEDYRVAHAIAMRPQRAEASTEEFRTAMIQYRAIFDELVQAQKPQEKRSAA